ncbi:hypothetical protein EC991_001235 [Linnemannia zychae]|nr:hypothetical protein EC991_001235 [Linnemannia zychae]
MTNTATDNKTLFVIKNVDAKLSVKEVAAHLNLAPEALTLDSHLNFGKTVAYQASVASVDEAMAVFTKHNFTCMGDKEIQMEFRPRLIYNRIPELEIVTKEPVRLKSVYEAFQKCGQVVSVFTNYHGRRQEQLYSVFFTTKNGARNGHRAVGEKHITRIGSQTVKVNGTRNIQPMEPDFWVSPLMLKPLPKAKGNLIGVPSNSPLMTTTSRTTGSKAITPSPLQVVKASFKLSAPPTEMVSFGSRPQDRRRSTSSSVPAKRQHHLSKVDQTNYSSAQEQRAHINLRNFKAVNPSHISHPGELEGQHRYEHRGSQNGTRDDWYSTAFICYESLYNQSSMSDAGSLSMSTLTWGSQLDISTFQLHYGSVFKPNDSNHEIPVASSMTVEMRQYGDKESAAEVLAIRNEGQLPLIARAMKEGANVSSRGKIMSMKALESGHLITSAVINNRQNKGLFIWDMERESEDAKIAVAKLSSDQSGATWIDAKGMDVCSVGKRSFRMVKDAIFENAL